MNWLYTNSNWLQIGCYTLLALGLIVLGYRII